MANPIYGSGPLRSRFPFYFFSSFFHVKFAYLLFLVLPRSFRFRLLCGLCSREGLASRQAADSDEIQLQIDPLRGDLDDHISGLRGKIRKLKGVSFHRSDWIPFNLMMVEWTMRPVFSLWTSKNFCFRCIRIGGLKEIAEQQYFRSLFWVFVISDGLGYAKLGLGIAWKTY